MNEQMPLVSVIIPTYNRPAYLKQTLESIVNQTYTNIEIIVVDDGSPNEDALDVCKNFETVTYLKIKNSGGPSKPRNIGIKKAKGKYIAFLDDDDLYVSNKIEQQVTALEKNKTFGIAHGYCQVINEIGKLKNEIIGKPGTPDVKHGDVSLRMIGNWTLMTSSVLIRKAIIDKIGFFNEEMPPAGEDVEFWVRCSFHTKFYYIDSPLVLYREHNFNISKQKKAYINLPLHLKEVLNVNLKKKIITKVTYASLKNNVSKMQIKMIRQNTFKTIRNLFKLQPLWFLNYGNIKLLAYKIVVK
ncbi:glycosyltransferase [Lutibacter sp.]|uniref:glycosyltransferase family 2 protein n=1 Tax=Lutibacter sp. TaxID=1925666 RepID=UPI0025C1A7C8|nr:glycosyltransferase [Lutibacter sp.]MCF6182886.1 glycosyltransferase [Lutibacter sp.]